MKKLLFLSLFFILLPSTVFAANGLTPEADQMYQKYHSSVLQVRVIARGSKEKSSLGSGFFFSADGLAATNYHVVSDAVNMPSQFSIEYILANGKSGEMEVLNIDPVHDLAILKIKEPAKDFLKLGDSHFEKGVKIFSFGNPHDLGLIVVEGLFNGLMEQSRYRKILFSGSINPGMSGGPAVDSSGRVLGINVSTAGNEISFFVPVEYLKDLYTEVKANQNQTLGPEWRGIIRKRLVLDAEEMIKTITSAQWEKSKIGKAEVPGKISEVFRCWGESGENNKYWMVGTYLYCSTEDEIFLSDTMNTGKIIFNYSWYESRDNDPVRFYNIYETYDRYYRTEFDNAEERDVSNFECSTEFVLIDGHNAKVEFCGRRYKSYSGLYDLTMKVNSVDMWNKGLIINVFVAGVTEMQGKRFLLKFLNEIKWEKSS